MFNPIGPRIKIKVVAQEEVSAGGIVMGATKKSEDTEIGEVVSLGHMAYKDISNETPWCKLGDKVLFQKYAGKLDPTDTDAIFRYLKDTDIIAVDTGE